MRITELIAFHVRIPLRKSIRHASHTRQKNDTLIVRCQLDNGATGWGEGLPRPYVTGETIESALGQFVQTDFRGQFGSTLHGLEDALRLCADWDLSPADAAASTGPGQERGTVVRRDGFGNSVRCAIELSVLDAVCRSVRAPLSAVTALLPETAGFRRQQERVRYGTVITSGGAFSQIAKAVKMRLFRFAQCKVKVGTAGIDDARSLKLIRRCLGRRVDLRIDANEAWTCDTLEEKLEPLLRFGVTCVEQPVPHEQVQGLAAVRPRLSVPIMLDESLCSLSDADAAIAAGTCDLFNIRLSKCGGFLNSLRLAAAAVRAGLGYQFGCMVGETGILSAAGRHFACSVGGIRYLEGSYDRFLVREPLTRENLTFGFGGFAPALAGPGLGVQVDEAAVERLTVKRHQHAFD